MATLFELKKEHHELLNAADVVLSRAENDGKRNLTTQEVTLFDAHMAKAKPLSERIAAIESNNTILPILRQNPAAFLTGGGVKDTGAIETWKDERGQPVPVLKNHQSFASVIQTGPAPNFGFGDFIKGMVLPSGNPEMQASLSEAAGIAGGDVTVPVNLLGGLIDLMRAKAVCIQAGALTVPITTELTNIARISADPVPSWRAEAGAVPTAAPTFERVQFAPKSLAVLVKVSQELLEDSININEAIMQCFAGAFATELDRVGLLGTGTAPQPHGIAGTTNVGNVSMGTNGLALTNYDPFVNAVSALLTANAAMPTAAIMSPRTLTKAALLKDTLNQPMRKPDLIATLPFLATTSIPNNQTQGTSSLASEAIVGNFANLLFGIRNSLRIRILQERFLGDTLEYGFLAFLRADVQLAHPQSFCEIVGIL
jgi:HK97 family phage major capsid protein